MSLPAPPITTNDSDATALPHDHLTMAAQDGANRSATVRHGGRINAPSMTHRPTNLPPASSPYGGIIYERVNQRARMTGRRDPPSSRYPNCVPSRSRGVTLPECGEWRSGSRNGRMHLDPPPTSLQHRTPISRPNRYTVTSDAGLGAGPFRTGAYGTLTGFWTLCIRNTSCRTAGWSLGSPPPARFSSVR